jgi:polyisoprenoid-binding protein YceI
MERFLVLLVLLLIVSGTTSASEKSWKSDAAHSGISFSVSHMVISDVEGRFKEFEAMMRSSKDDFTDAIIEVTVKPNSIDTDNEKRDSHLRSADFFDSEKYPEATFHSISIKKTGKDAYTIKGDLTIRGVTKPVELKAKLRGVAKDPWGGTRAGFKATTTINRTEWGLVWNKTLETGGLLVGEDVDLTINVEFVLEKS